jgi:hypothetical protein
MPIAGRILNQYSLLEYPDNTYTYVRTDSTNCVVNNAHEGGAYYDGSGHVCLRGSGATGWDDATTYKFLVGHVFGHRMADVNGGPLNSGFDNDDAPGPCRCIDFTAYGGNTHCMGSRDPIEAAESEGFADFFSTAVFNNRSESETKIFSYPQETYFCFLSGGKGYLNIDWDPPHVFPASLDESGSNCNTFMTYVCDPGEADLGVELDWLRLTWELWTTGNEFSMDQISDIWEDTSGGNWDDLLATVESQWEASDPDKVNVFNNKSIQSGVNHYSD